MHLFRETRSARLPGLTVLVIAGLLSACAGENLFSLAASVGTTGPDVTITEPVGAATVAEGVPIEVTAAATAPDGLRLATYSGVFQESGEAAFRQEVETFANVTVASLNKTLLAVDLAGTGAVYIIVKVTDALGATAADTVSITVN